MYMANSLLCSLETITLLLIDYQFSSVSQLCPTLCNPINHSTQGLPVHHQLLEFTQIHVKANMVNNHIIGALKEEQNSGMSKYLKL